ncbi:stage II sporulation protein D [Bacillus sp. FJAT-42315]|uniref:stage II sporulation protein D n=2 Tax=Bacillus sp. FJAT-42315 TaxID=2014077 RepID=UPI000C23AE8C|nr:stage II sporulation protein D [Bacillus sp. FJAT-42315]
MEKQRHSLFLIIAALFFTALVIPSLLVLIFSPKEEEMAMKEPNKTTPNAPAEEPAVEVAVFRSGSQQIENFPLEQYVAGVVAAEMPAEFEKEALKAQALTARTFIIQHMMNGKTVSNGQAHVTDTVNHQVFQTKSELEKTWGNDFSWKWKKINEAVQETKGEIITYDGTPITASFFSTSNGYTENSEDYWGQPLPYLKSVASPWDEQSPKYRAQLRLPLSEFERKLGVSIDGGQEAGMITKRTPGQRIAKVKIGNKEFSGREVREKLQLPSSDFSWVVKGDEVIVSTKGYGHGVGMSQYGANGMAKEGKDHQQIIHHYYQQIKIDKADRYVDEMMTAKK